MGYIGVSLIVASVVWVIVAPPPWINHFLPPFFAKHHQFLTSRRALASSSNNDDEVDEVDNSKSDKNAPKQEARNTEKAEGPRIPDVSIVAPTEQPPPTKVENKTYMAPSPVPLISPPTIAEPAPEEEQTTPKAQPATISVPVPAFSLTTDTEPTQRSTNLQPITTTTLPKPPPQPSSMAPPPPPSAIPPRLAPPRLQPIPSFPAASSPQRARAPLPNRSPGASSSSLAPPPTHSQAPQKPSRKVLLTPGHSPLDWARISGPAADLRNLPPQTPYLKVTPSMLKRQTGRKGKDAWMALGGRVYNVTPYLDFHPGGVPEVMRGAGRDGSTLFGEIHPWVNYETMLSACLVGVLVQEEEGQGAESEMDRMD